jgi:hypothetical protein
LGLFGIAPAAGCNRHSDSIENSMLLVSGQQRQGRAPIPDDVEGVPIAVVRHSLRSNRACAPRAIFRNGAVVLEMGSAAIAAFLVVVNRLMTFRAA